MEEIVKKLEDAPPQLPRQPGQEIRVRVRAETLGGQKKRAEVWGETSAGVRRNSRWQMFCDEGKAIGGQDTAPSPLAYFSAGIAF